MRHSKSLYQGIALLALSLSIKAHAALPTPTLPAGTTATGGDWLSMLKALTKSGTDLALLIVSVIAFLIVGYAAVTKFIEANNGRAAWGEVGLLAVVGVFVVNATEPNSPVGQLSGLYSLQSVNNQAYTKCNYLPFSCPTQELAY